MVTFPFINQELKNVSFIGLMNEQFYTLQNFKSNKQYFEYDDSMRYFEDVFPKEWLLGYHSYVRFGASQSTCALLNDKKYYSIPEGLNIADTRTVLWFLLEFGHHFST